MEIRTSKMSNSVNPERYMLSETARRRQRIVERIECMILAACGAGLYALLGLALRWAGVA